MLQNTLALQIVSADIPGLLYQIVQKNIIAYDLKTINDITITLSVKRKDYHEISALVNKRGDHIKVIRHKGLAPVIKALTNRPVFMAGILVLLVLSLYLPTRVLFVRVEGNMLISTQLILQKAEECDIRFGASRKLVRSEQVKNNLLAMLPQLQWAGVNTYGCIAVISVEEKSSSVETRPAGQVSSIVALRDGVVNELTVRNGSAHCRVGQAVREGQLLVSGYSDCGFKVLAQNADAEIVAQTIRNLDVLTPGNCEKRGAITSRNKKIYLQIGKKLIKLCDSSGILDSTCVKMYSRKYLTLPGGLQLPVALVTVNYTHYTTVSSCLSREQGRDMLERFASEYLLMQMIAGQITHAQTVILSQDDRYLLTGEYVCTEQIGRTIYEESFYTDGKDD